MEMDAGLNLASLTAGESPQPKSRFLGVVYSLLLPGMGELYAERFDAGLYPLVLEGALWLGFAGFNAYGGWLRSDSRSYAIQHAGANIDGKDDQFFVDIANYSSTHDYNQQKLIDRNLAALYSEDPGSPYLWNWSSDAERQKYKDQRTHSEEMYNASKFVVLGMIANRIWSAIQASIFTRNYNSRLAGHILPVTCPPAHPPDRVSRAHRRCEFYFFGAVLTHLRRSRKLEVWKRGCMLNDVGWICGKEIS